MKDWLDRPKQVIGIVTVCVGAALWINNSINELEVRVAAMESKMDILIQGLNISVEPAAGDS